MERWDREKNATDSIGDTMITARAMDDVEVVRLQTLNPFTDLLVVQLLVATEEPLEGSVVDEGGSV